MLQSPRPVLFRKEAQRNPSRFLIEKHKQLRISEGHRVAVNRELTALSVLFNRCRQWKKYGGENPVRLVKKINEPMNRLRFLSEEEERALLSECDEPLKTIVLLGIYAGLRIGAEALTLKKANVDLKRKVITIEAAYSKNKENDTLPIHSRLLGPLQARPGSQGEFVFEKAQSKSIRSIRTAFTNVCQRAKLSDVTPHTLRHTFASRLGMAGVNNVTLQKLRRWKEAKMIQRYAHLSEQHLADAIEKIGSDSTTVFTTLKTASS